MARTHTHKNTPHLQPKAKINTCANLADLTVKEPTYMFIGPGHILGFLSLLL